MISHGNAPRPFFGWWAQADAKAWRGAFDRVEGTIDAQYWGRS
ncbi:hypothetical protein Z948_2861 [Sulfitobacter donghicola DSW-25 = KCTC 12864 = JCM 14565]|nr:hypothetical protein Z948_2861 [Sulfitobacter donghicola DSW-25 = KCTC 12864 = JCM 14565]